jgi:hypothetical protein
MIPHYLTHLNLWLVIYVTIGCIIWRGLIELSYKQAIIGAVVLFWPLIVLALIAVEINLAFNGLSAATANQMKSAHISHRS